MTKPWMLYGANGYTGRLIAEEAARKGLRPIVAGRHEAPIAALAELYGFEFRVFEIDEIDPHIEDVSAVCLAAGPFARTSRPFVDACVRTRTHYLDISGEIPVLEAVMLRSEEARIAGITLLPGVGFDVAPSDCLAKRLSEALPDGTALELAFRAASGPSGGTARTAVEALPSLGAVRSDGRIVPVPPAHASIEVPFRDGVRTAMSVGMGDVATAYYSTGIANVVTYIAAPSAAIRAVRALRPLSMAFRSERARRLAGRVAARAAKGPDADRRARARMQIWGRITTPDGRVVTGTLTTPEGYALTATIAVEATQRVVEGRTAPGAFTPAMAFGSGFIAELAGCDLRVPRSA